MRGRWRVQHACLTGSERALLPLLPLPDNSGYPTFGKKECPYFALKEVLLLLAKVWDACLAPKPAPAIPKACSF